MKHLTQEQLVDLSVVVNKVTREQVKQVLQATGMTTEADERIVAVASMCAAQAAAYTLTYLYEMEKSGTVNIDRFGSLLQ